MKTADVSDAVPLVTQGRVLESAQHARHGKAVHRIVATIASLVVWFAACPAWADAYAYSEDLITMLNFGNATFVPNSLTSSGWNVASYDGFGADHGRGPLDAPQAKSGPGAFPPENSFGEWYDTGKYARADSIITSTDIHNISGQSVAEDYRPTAGSAGSAARDSLSFGINVVNSNQPVSISLTAQPLMIALSSQKNEYAYTFTTMYVELLNDDTHQPVFLWTPDGNDEKDFQLFDKTGVVTDVKDPFSLNTRLLCSNQCSEAYNEGSGNFTINFKDPPIGKYKVFVGWSERASVGSVPEPSSLLLLGSAVLGLGGILRRRLSKNV